MFLQLYSICVLIWDVSWLILYSIYFILKAAKELLLPPPLKSVSKEVVMVVGCGRGVGKEIVKIMAMLGATVVCVDINKDSNNLTVMQIKQMMPYKSKKIHSFTCDVTNHSDVIKLANDIKNEVGNITMMFHCCGIPSPRSLLTEDPRNLNKTFDLAIMSQFWLLDAFLPTMIKNNHGHIVALTSVAGLSGQKEQLPLSVSQFAVQGLAESLLEEFRINRKDNIHVTIIHIYPFILNSDTAADIRLRIPSYFGTIKARLAAQCIIDAVRRNYIEVSIPKHLIFIGHLLRILPRQATIMIREMLDTGVDFA
ncbi:epidermal retinol dehydrogenase 2-like isoform X2 [Arctopsyche grandis]